MVAYFQNRLIIGFKGYKYSGENNWDHQRKKIET
jgi:hypothetical protein